MNQEGVLVRDRIREREFLGAAEAAATAHGFAEHAHARLEDGEIKFGDRWTRMSLDEFLTELREEAADLGAWAALAEQAAVQHSADVLTQHVSATLLEYAHMGARAHRAIENLRRTVGRA